MGTMLPPGYGSRWSSSIDTSLRTDMQDLYGPGPVRVPFLVTPNGELIETQLPPPAILHIMALGLFKMGMRVVGPSDRVLEGHQLLMRI